MTLSHKFTIFLLCLILILGFWLRHTNYLEWPRHGATFDEFAWSWLGINLIQKGEPISWSRHPQYTNRQNIIYQGAAFTIVRPYLEHPPLFGLVVGATALARGAKNMYDITLHKIRPLALILGVLSVAAVFLLADGLYGRVVGLIAAILYATVPTIVVGSRIVQNENFFIPFWLFSVFFLHKYVKTKKIVFRNSAIILGGLLPLAKVPWIAAPISIALILAYQKKWKDVFLTIVVSALIFSTFIFYGLYFNSQLFFGLWGLQLARYDLTFTSLFSIFLDPLIVDRQYLDGWIYFGFLAIMLVLSDYKKHVFVVFPFLAYFLIFTAGIPSEPGHGWYRYPFYPFLIIAVAIFIRNYLFNNPLLAFLFFIIVGLPLFAHTWVPTFGFSIGFMRLVLIIFSTVLLPLFFMNKGLHASIKIGSYSLFCFLILLNIWSVFLYNEQ